MAASLPLPIPSTSRSPFPYSLPLRRPSSPLRRHSSPLRRHSSPLRLTITCSTSADAAAEPQKNGALERRGLDPADFGLSPPRRGRRKGKWKEGKGRRSENAAVTPEELKPSRTTHKLLKVLSGKARRTKLLSPSGMDVRPMMEVVKGASFSIIQAASGSPASLRPGRWLDLYSGTGSVGIEALSRGCTEAHFVEMDPWVVDEVLKPNLECTGFLDASVIHTAMVENYFKSTDRLQGAEDSAFDYISVTPPYTAVDYTILMDQLENSPLVGEDTFILVEYPLKLTLCNFCKSLVKIVDRRYGRTNLAVYGPTWSQKKRKSQIS